MKIPASVKSKFISIILSFIGVCALLLISILAPEKQEEIISSGNKYMANPFCVTFFDVGQGDCEIISCNGYNILIDGGESENSGKIVRYLKDNGIEKLDCYILTHPHSDHIGVAPYILKEIPCDKVFTTYFSEFNIPTTSLYESTLDAIYESGAEPVLVEAGDSFTFGDLKIDIVAPVYESDDYNAMSIVCKATYKDSSVLFTGDTTKSVEKQILDRDYDVDADILKAAHHGSSTSSSEDFFDAVDPEAVIISCGADNSYGHPHREVMKLLNDKETEYFRTDYDGTVYYFGDGVNMILESSR